MQIVKFQREQEHHLAHIDRIRNIKPVLNSSTPESLGLKHLAYRPKKMQLVEDRRQVVAQENAKLMDLMTGIMNEKRKQPKYVRPSSLNEVERKREVDRLNFENSLMAHRLNRVASVINNAQIEKDFKRHLHAEANLRRRQMKLLGLPKDLHNSSLRNPNEGDTAGSFGGITSGLFDSGLYTSQNGHHLQGNNLDYLEGDLSSSGSPIRSVTDFRKQVIAKKKAEFSSSASKESKSSPIELPSINPRMHNTRNETLYEAGHVPS